MRYTLYLVGLGALLGSSFPFMRLALESFPPLTIVAVRLGISALLLTLLLFFQRQLFPRSPRVWVDLALVGLIGTVIPMFLITWGIQHISSSLAAILVATTPMFALLLSVLWTRQERLGLTHMVGMLLGFGGVLIALDITTLTLGSASAWGILAVLLGALSYAVEGVYGQKAFQQTPALVAGAGTLSSGACVIIPIALVGDGVPTLTPTPLALVGIVGLTVFSSGLAHTLLFWMLERVGAARTTMVGYLVPIFAILLSWLWLGEVLPLHAIGGLMLVLIGITVSNYRKAGE
jgi:drug/metabolite transporter (DMT)-like permease